MLHDVGRRAVVDEDGVDPGGAPGDVVGGGGFPRVLVLEEDAEAESVAVLAALFEGGAVAVGVDVVAGPAALDGGVEGVVEHEDGGLEGAPRAGIVVVGIGAVGEELPVDGRGDGLRWGEGLVHRHVAPAGLAVDLDEHLDVEAVGVAEGLGAEQPGAALLAVEHLGPLHASPQRPRHGHGKLVVGELLVLRVGRVLADVGALGRARRRRLDLRVAIVVAELADPHDVLRVVFPVGRRGLDLVPGVAGVLRRVGHAGVEAFQCLAFAGLVVEILGAGRAVALAEVLHPREHGHDLHHPRALRLIPHPHLGVPDGVGAVHVLGVGEDLVADLHVALLGEAVDVLDDDAILILGLRDVEVGARVVDGEDDVAVVGVALEEAGLEVALELGHGPRREARRDVLEGHDDGAEGVVGLLRGVVGAEAAAPQDEQLAGEHGGVCRAGADAQVVDGVVPRRLALLVDVLGDGLGAVEDRAVADAELPALLAVDGALLLAVIEEPLLVARAAAAAHAAAALAQDEVALPHPRPQRVDALARIRRDLVEAVPVALARPRARDRDVALLGEVLALLEVDEDLAVAVAEGVGQAVLVLGLPGLEEHLGRVAAVAVVVEGAEEHALVVDLEVALHGPRGVAVGDEAEGLGELLSLGRGGADAFEVADADVEGWREVRGHGRRVGVDAEELPAAVLLVFGLAVAGLLPVVEAHGGVVACGVDLDLVEGRVGGPLGLAGGVGGLTGLGGELVVVVAVAADEHEVVGPHGQAARGELQDAGRVGVEELLLDRVAEGDEVAAAVVDDVLLLGALGVDEGDLVVGAFDDGQIVVHDPPLTVGEEDGHDLVGAGAELAAFVLVAVGDRVAAGAVDADEEAVAQEGELVGLGLELRPGEVDPLVVVLVAEELEDAAAVEAAHVVLGLGATDVGVGPRDLLAVAAGQVADVAAELDAVEAEGGALDDLLLLGLEARAAAGGALVALGAEAREVADVPGDPLLLVDVLGVGVVLGDLAPHQHDAGLRVLDDLAFLVGAATGLVLLHLEEAEAVGGVLDLAGRRAQLGRVGLVEKECLEGLVLGEGGELVGVVGDLRVLALDEPHLAEGDGQPAFGRDGVAVESRGLVLGRRGIPVFRGAVGREADGEGGRDRRGLLVAVVDGGLGHLGREILVEERLLAGAQHMGNEVLGVVIMAGALVEAVVVAVDLDAGALEVLAGLGAARAALAAAEARVAGARMLDQLAAHDQRVLARPAIGAEVLRVVVVGQPVARDGRRRLRQVALQRARRLVAAHALAVDEQGHLVVADAFHRAGDVVPALRLEGEDVVAGGGVDLEPHLGRELLECGIAHVEHQVARVARRAVVVERHAVDEGVLGQVEEKVVLAVVEVVAALLVLGVELDPHLEDEGADVVAAVGHVAVAEVLVVAGLVDEAALLDGPVLELADADVDALGLEVAVVAGEHLDVGEGVGLGHAGAHVAPEGVAAEVAVEAGDEARRHVGRAHLGGGEPQAAAAQADRRVDLDVLGWDVARLGRIGEAGDAMGVSADDGPLEVVLRLDADLEVAHRGDLHDLLHAVAGQLAAVGRVDHAGGLDRIDVERAEAQRRRGRVDVERRVVPRVDRVGQDGRAALRAQLAVPHHPVEHAREVVLDVGEDQAHLHVGDHHVGQARVLLIDPSGEGVGRLGRHDEAIAALGGILDDVALDGHPAIGRQAGGIVDRDEGIALVHAVGETAEDAEPADEVVDLGRRDAVVLRLVLLVGEAHAEEPRAQRLLAARIEVDGMERRGARRHVAHKRGRVDRDEGRQPVELGGRDVGRDLAELGEAGELPFLGVTVLNDGIGDRMAAAGAEEDLEQVPQERAAGALDVDLALLVGHAHAPHGAVGLRGLHVGEQVVGEVDAELAVGIDLGRVVHGRRRGRCEGLVGGDLLEVLVGVLELRDGPVERALRREARAHPRREVQARMLLLPHGDREGRRDDRQCHKHQHDHQDGKPATAGSAISDLRFAIDHHLFASPCASSLHAASSLHVRSPGT